MKINDYVNRLSIETISATLRNYESDSPTGTIHIAIRKGSAQRRHTVRPASQRPSAERRHYGADEDHDDVSHQARVDLSACRTLHKHDVRGRKSMFVRPLLRVLRRSVVTRRSVVVRRSVASHPRRHCCEASPTRLGLPLSPLQ